MIRCRLGLHRFARFEYRMREFIDTSGPHMIRGFTCPCERFNWTYRDGNLIRRFDSRSTRV